MILLSLLPQMAAKMASQPSSPSWLPLRSTDVNAPLTKSILATCLAPAVPPMLEPVPRNELSPLKSSSLRVLLPTRASQRNLVPSSPNLFLASDSFVSAPMEGMR